MSPTITLQRMASRGSTHAFAPNGCLTGPETLAKIDQIASIGSGAFGASERAGSALVRALVPAGAGMASSHRGGEAAARVHALDEHASVGN